MVNCWLVWILFWIPSRIPDIPFRSFLTNASSAASSSGESVMLPSLSLSLSSSSLLSLSIVVLFARNVVSAGTVSVSNVPPSSPESALRLMSERVDVPPANGAKKEVAAGSLFTFAATFLAAAEGPIGDLDLVFAAGPSAGGFAGGLPMPAGGVVNIANTVVKIANTDIAAEVLTLQ